MKEAQALTSVAKFHHLFGAPVLEKPTIPSQQRCDLRVNLLQEELNELADAIKDGDLIEIADALGDIQYVLSGAIHEFGMGHCFNDVFSEIQRSNMSKACKTLQEAQDTVKHYKENKDTESHITETDGLFLVHRLGDNKVLKSINYSPANLQPIIKSAS